jgi:hypothetical protein
MARFFGKVGFGESVEMAPGNWEDVIIEHDYYGDVIRPSRRLEQGPKVNSDISVGNSISILADAYANENFIAIRYVQWAGQRWIVSNVEVQRPRLLLELGGVYNGPTA